MIERIERYLERERERERESGSTWSAAAAFLGSPQPQATGRKPHVRLYDRLHYIPCDLTFSQTHLSVLPIIYSYIHASDSTIMFTHVVKVGTSIDRSDTCTRSIRWSDLYTRARACVCVCPYVSENEKEGSEREREKYETTLPPSFSFSFYTLTAGLFVTHLTITPCTHALTHSLSLSLSLTHTHTHIRTCERPCRRHRETFRGARS